MPAFSMPATLEDVEKARNIGIDISMRIDQGMTHAGLRGEMHDSRKAMRSKQRRYGFALANVHLDEFEIGERLELREPSLLETRIVIGIEVIEAHHVVSVRQEAARHMHPDEPGRAGNENRLLQARSFQMTR